MTLAAEELNKLILEVARGLTKTFRRRKLLLAVEERAKADGVWTPEDDVVVAKNRTAGLKAIDLGISHLEQNRRLTREGQDIWRVQN